MPAVQDEPAPAPQGPPYSDAEVRRFLQRAVALDLQADPYWRTLLHTGATAKRFSRVDDPAFFLAPHGKYDPATELIADLAAFFAPLPADANLAAANRFPARLEWLAERLGIDRARLPLAGSAAFEAVLRDLAPRGAALVFPAAYMNTPASMFGHTLLIIRSRYKSTLLSQSVNYAASTDTNNGVAFALKGIFGLYPGYYSFLPYYQKVAEYTDLDQRDIWEYELSFSAPELRHMLLHVWEMRGIHSDYYFFDENCCFNLLYLIDAARPGLDLHERTGGWVIPLDTVKLMQGAGLIAAPVYRPSRTTRVHHLASQLSAEQGELARALAHGESTPEAVAQSGADATTQARILDLSAEYLQSLRGRKKVAQAVFQHNLIPILTARSRLAVPPAPADAAVPVPASPDRGHPSARVTLGAGRLDDLTFGELGIRPAYHDLTDPIAGYLPGAQIEFANLSLRWYEKEAHPQLNRFDAINLSSFATVDRFYQPLAWRVDTGLLREEQGAPDGWHNQAFLNGGAGVCVGLGGLGLGYALFDADVRIGGRDPHHAIGFGPEAGLLLRVGDAWFLGPHASLTRYVLGDRGTNWQLGAQLRCNFTGDVGIGIEASRGSAWDLERTVLAVRAYWFF
ncbi:MAG: DUF4105 domain-containing protein [Planctomycetes bacterium]|nr:DUF4105 domain-containing protein [Planctomycetota bacterium]